MHYNKEHSIYDEMRAVHTAMLTKYNLERSAAEDIARAKTMEKYLRAFKNAGNKHKDKNNNVIQDSLEEQAMSDLAEQVGQSLGIGKYSLFRNAHSWYLDSQARWGADDVFEAEFAKFLDISLDKATDGKADSGAKLIGNLAGNISKEYMQEVSARGQEMIDSKYVSSELITKPTFRSGKVDVESFSATITATVQPQWEEFINAFKGARFTVKNYSSNSNTEVIHLGNTDITKTLIGALSDINYGVKEATHIFYHSLHYVESGDGIVGGHVLHLRFSYELAGGGLQDQSGNRIDAADFFVYNDPASNNIWVRSTKEMIANAMNYMGNVKDPLHSGIVLLKTSF